MLFAIGDVHGHHDKLIRVMEHCRAFAEARGERHASYILLGDCVDRGPDSAGILAWLASSPANVHAIAGNHEDMMLQAVAGGEPLLRWLSNGGGDTLRSYGGTSIRDVPARHLALIAGLPLFFDDGLRLFVHAGIDPAHPDSRDPAVLLWTRRHPPDDQTLPRFVVHGHTPTKTGRPDLRPNRLNLDTGAGWGRRLTAAAFMRDQAKPIAFIDDLAQVTPTCDPEADRLVDPNRL
jgi:serine/threonine protein phosphatase 1